MSVQPRLDLTGRKKIYTDVEEVTSENVLDLLRAALATHALNSNCIDYLYNYNKGLQPILQRNKTVRPKINNKIVANRANEITTFEVGYLLGEPLQYVSRNVNDDTAEKITKLNDFMYNEDKALKDKELAYWFKICGTAYRMVLPNKDSSAYSPFCIYTLDPRQTFVVYHSGLGEYPVLGVKYVEQSNQRIVYSVYTKNCYYEIIDDAITTIKPHALGAIPIIEYPANEERLGTFEKVLPLLDAYNLALSDRMNGLEQFVQAFIKFVNVEIDDRGAEQLNELGGIRFKSTSENPADVEYITPELDQTNSQIVLDDLYQTILTICGMPNRNGGSSTSDTGSAVILRDGWEAAEARAKDSEAVFKRSEKSFLRIALNILNTCEHIDLQVPQIDIRFTRRNYENIQEKSNVLLAMLSNDKIHPQLAFEHSGMFADAGLAYKVSAEYAAKQAAKLLDTSQKDDEENGGLSDDNLNQNAEEK